MCKSLTADAKAWQPLAGHPSLRRIDAGRCESLAAVPATLSTLTGLTQLWLMGCRLHALPPELAALSAVIRL